MTKVLPSIRILIISSYWLLFNILVAQELPPIQSFLPEAYNAETQNWSISQSDTNYIYVANNQGLLEYNGATWELYPTPNGTIMRSVHVVKDRIYTGFYMNFGYWKKNQTGNLTYTSLSDSIAAKLKEDEQFWRIVHSENHILFQSLDRIYIYNTVTNKIEIINAETGMVNLFEVSGTIYYQEKEKGLYTIEKGAPKQMIDATAYNDDTIVHISHTPKGLLLLTSTQGLLEWIAGTIHSDTIAANAILKHKTIYAAQQLRDQSFIIGTIANGMLHVSSKGVLQYTIDQSKGLNTNTVLAVFEDTAQNIWLGLDNGINCINIQSPIRNFKDTKGKIGTVYTTVVHRDTLYLGTNQGLFYKPIKTDEIPRFIPKTHGQVWSLYLYDQTLFCGHTNGTFVIKNTKAHKIVSTAGGWVFKTIPKHPNWLLQGTYTGLILLEKTQNTWKYKHKIKGFDYSARFVEHFQQALWVNHEYKGLYRLEINDAYTQVTHVQKDTTVARGKNSKLLNYRGTLWYAHEEAIYRYHPKEKRFQLDNVLQATFDIIPKGKFVKDNTGTLWNFNQDALGYIIESKFSDQLRNIQIPISHTARKEMTGFENIVYLQDQQYLIGTTEGYMRINRANTNFQNNHQLILHKVAIKQKETVFREIPLQSAEPPTIDYKENTIAFSYAIPTYDTYLRPKYQYKLVGYHQDWSDWATNSHTVFENLPSGHYTLLLRGTIDNTESNTSVYEYAFSIARPWYLSIVAIMLYGILLLMMIIGIHKYYSRYYFTKQLESIQASKKQLEIKKLTGENELVRTINQKLKEELEEKKRELASATMHILKKNKILIKVKKELSRGQTHIPDFKQLKKKIHRSLNEEEDWKHFEQAFSNLDKDFLKKLKDKHPTLTPNDLKFCTYLRLNLSSKEVAPLLNISVRSVEIKRYRLRKKLNLAHSKSLVSYILEV